MALLESSDRLLSQLSQELGIEQSVLRAWRRKLRPSGVQSSRPAASAGNGHVAAVPIELTDPSFHFSVLSEFHARLVAGNATRLLLDTMLERFKARGLVKSRGKQRTDSTHGLGAARDLHLLELVTETLGATLDALAAVCPDWLRGVAQPARYERYARRAKNLCAVRGRHAALARGEGVAARRRARPVSSRSRDALQYEAWDEVSGYTVHITEACDDDTARIITHLRTGPAMLADMASTAAIHAVLAAKGLLPSEHHVGSGYVDADLLVTSRRDHGVSLEDPVRAMAAADRG